MPALTCVWMEHTKYKGHCGAHAEKVVQVYGFCIRTLRLPVISVMIIGVMRSSYNEKQFSCPDPTQLTRREGVSLVPRPRALPGEKWSGERSRIPWA